MLDDLVARWEARPAATRILARIDEAAFGSVAERDRFARELSGVEAAGGVAVRRRRLDGDEVVDHVRLLDPQVVCTFLGRTPARHRSRDGLAAARSRRDLPSAADTLFQEIDGAWSRGVSSFGLEPGDARGLARALDLALALVRRTAGSEAEIDFRSFSRTAGLDSKALERSAAGIVSMLARLFPERFVAEGLEPREFLATLGVTKLAQPLLLGGPVAVAGTDLPALAFVGVPPECGTELRLSGPVEYVLTIENYVSFVRHTREVNAGRTGLVVYTGGFPARSHLAAIVRLAEQARAPTFHWGDMDAGGLRIFVHLERALVAIGVPLKPHLMDPEVLRRDGVPSRKGRRLSPGAHPSSAVAELWDLVGGIGLCHEQESIAPRIPDRTR